MNTTSDDATRTRFTWLVRVGYALVVVGVLLLFLLGAHLPIDMFGGPHHFYRLAPAERGWVVAALPVGLGVLLVRVGRALRSRSR
jgi:TRAP-type C4-dicarboxylate transport system permease small subunit